MSALFFGHQMEIRNNASYNMLYNTFSTSTFTKLQNYHGNNLEVYMKSQVNNIKYKRNGKVRF